MRYLFICGLPGSGKGTLRVLLDGSDKNIINCPFQGFGYEILSEKFDNFLDRKKTIDVIDREKNMSSGFIYIKNRFLTAGEFFYLISYSLRILLDSSNGSKIRAASTQSKEQFVKFLFNYEIFFRKLLIIFNRKNKFKDKFQLYDFFIKTFIHQWKGVKTIQNKSIILISMQNGAQVLKDINKNVPKTRYQIFSVSRKLEDFIAVNYSRYSSKRKPKINFLFKIKYIYSINNFKKYSEYFKFQKDFEKQNLYEVEFNELITNTEEIMKSISKFIGIEYSKKMLLPSLNSILLKNNFTGKVIDKHNFSNFDLLSLSLFNKVLKYLNI